MLNYFWSPEQLFLFYIMGIMVCTGLIKEYNLFAGFYNFLLEHIKNKKVLVTLVSALSGILPVPGRVVVSASVLDTMSPKDKSNREKFGIVNYISTHLYYLFSPLEKTIALPMAALGLSYVALLHYTLPLLIVSLVFFIVYLSVFVDKEDIQIEFSSVKPKQSSFICVLPMIAAIIWLIKGYQPHIIFAWLSFIYILITQEFNIKKLLGYINWKVLIYVSVVIALSGWIRDNSAAHYTQFEEYVKNFGLTSTKTFVVVSGLAFIISFCLGSSSKFAGIVVLLTSLYGLPYLTYFMALEYAGYLVSPMHKCSILANTYFGTKFTYFYKIIGIWISLVIITGLLCLVR